MIHKNEQPEPADSFEFSGREEIYDDGIFRITIPAELTPEVVDESLCFHIEGLPFGITWETLVLEKSELNQMECPSEPLEDVMRFFMPDLSPEDPLRPVFMANGFHLASHGCIREGECRNRCILAAVDDNTAVLASMEVTAPAEWKDDPRLFGMLHLLRRSVRFARCSMGEPRINTSRAWLNVQKIGIRFPEALGGMAYRYATDYEFQYAGHGVCLRYSDEEGRKADLYIYDFGEEFIEAGADSDPVIGQMDAAMLQMEAVCEPAIPELISESLSSFGRQQMPFLDRRFLVLGSEPQGGPWITAILLSATRGAFIKIRFSALPGDEEPQHPLLTAFMNDLADVLSA